MSRVCYVPKRFTKGHLKTIDRANEVLAEYAPQGFVLTLRQLYYQFVARGWFPNKQKWYKRLGKIIGDARLAGKIDWEHMEDRVRNLSSLQHFDGPQDALDKLVSWYHVDMWENQKWRPEVWVEKDALSGVVAGVCEENDVPYFCCRGYTSLSEMWRASLRLREYTRAGQTPYIIHFGDHDPSGIDMSRDILDRLRETFRADLKFKRVALTMDQVEEYNPPPNPAKVTDSRFKMYQETYGDESWELDALDPPKFRQLIEAELDEIRDTDQWDKDAAAKARVIEQLTTLAKEWDSLPAQKKRLTDLDKVIEAARDAGWDGVNNSKLLWVFVRGLGDDLRTAAENLAKAEKALADLKKRKGKNDGSP